MKRKSKSNGTQTMHLKVSQAHLALLRRMANDERRTLHNLAVLILESGIERRAEAK